MSASKSVATFGKSDTLPAHLQGGTGLGSENVTSDQLQIPRLGLIQQLSPQIIKSKPEYIPEAETGLIFNSLTSELYKNVFVVNLLLTVQHTIWKKRKEGGGMEGNFDSHQEAADYMDANGLDPLKHDIVETAIHKCLMLDEDGQPKQPVLIYMSSSAMKKSNAWNTLISLQAKGADRFATVWSVSAIEEANKKGDLYQNWATEFAGYADEGLYAEAKKVYLSLVGAPVH